MAFSRSSSQRKRRTSGPGKRRSRQQLKPRSEKRGLSREHIRLDLGEDQILPLARTVAEAGGVPIGAYREPFSGRPLLLASLPLTSVEPTPFQRDLSPTHTRRLAQKIEESGSFLDPLIVVQGADGRLWTPNGRHRLAAAKVLGLHQVTALISPDESLTFRILALNTEKAHSLKDRSLEVIRMARELAVRRPRAKESAFASEFEAPELLTLGLIYQDNKRFAGGAYTPFLKKVDRFSQQPLTTSLRKRQDFAARLQEIDSQVRRLINGLQKRGLRSPYLRNYVVARINPVRFRRTKKEGPPSMTMSAALIRMATAARKFDLNGVKFGDVALVAAATGSDE